jgi:ubiquinone/menaquinone biosynthesis C-methylase UbiE
MSNGPNTSYLLGHSEQERSRLKRQALLYHAATLDILCRAGIKPGMRVLDVGCGVGDVSFAVRELVRETGEILGIDRSAGAISEAARRASDAGWSNLRFEVADCNSYYCGEKFDAVVGRLVLMYQPDPVATLMSCQRLLRPGGGLVFLEYDMGVAPFSCPPVELFDRTGDAIKSTFTAAGGRLRMGAELYSTFLRAGLRAPELHVQVPAGGGPDWVVYEMVADVARTLLPMMEKFGIATAQEMEIDTLADRLRKACLAEGSATFAPALIGAWIPVTG